MGPKWFNVPSKCLLFSWICWFSLVRNVWGFLVTPYDPTTANENLENKKYFCLGLLSNLEGPLRPIDNRSILLGILIFCFTMKINVFPREMVSQWARCMAVEKNPLSLVVMYCQFPQKLGARSIQMLTLPRQPELFLYVRVWTAVGCYSLEGY